MHDTTNSIPAANGNLSTLAKEINQHHKSSRRSAKNAIDEALAAGDKLIYAKSQLSHGQWGKWLADNVSFSERKAQAYMQLANGREALKTKTAEPADLTIDAAIKLLAAPRPKVFAPPDLTGDLIFVAAGEDGVIAQVEPSIERPHLHYVTTLNTETGALVEAMRPFNLKKVPLEKILAESDFVQCDDWQTCGRDCAPIPLVDESVRWAAYMRTSLRGEKWEDAVLAATT